MSTVLVETGSLGIAARDGSLRVRGLDLRVRAGERVVLVGPADAGEAVLRAIVGVDLPESGSARLLGAEVAALGRREACALLARAGWLPRRGALLANLTLRENLLLPLAFHRRAACAEAEGRVRSALARFGLAEAPDVRPEEAPLAVRRRVALARAVLLDPEVLVLADPVDDMEESDEAELLAALAAWAAEGSSRALLVAAQRHAVAGPLRGATLNLPVIRA